jgi:hypothetical protein
VGIIGIGGLGQMGVRLAKAMGRNLLVQSTYFFIHLSFIHLLMIFNAEFIL